MDEKIRILVVEDEPSDLQLIERELKQAGFSSITRCVDTREGFIEQLKDFEPDVVLSDYSMPHFSGVEAIRIIKEEYPSIPLIIVTGTIDEETAVKCMKEGADDYVLKERIARLGIAIRGTLEKRQMQLEKEQIEIVLWQSAQEWRTTFDSIGDAITLLDREGRILRCNQAMRDLIDQPWKDIIGRPCWELTHGTSEPIEECPYVRMKETLNREASDLQLKNRWYHVIVDPLLDQSGLLTGAVHILQDITQRRKEEEDRQKLELQFQQAQKLESLGVLAGGIAHDFNNLLMAILGNADLAMSEISPVSPARESIDEIVNASRRAAELCRQMLAYSGKGRFEIAAFNLSEIVEEMAHMLGISISKKAILKYNFAENIPSIKADITQIRQIVMNLITNASDAIGDKSGLISISTGVMECDRAYLENTAIWGKNYRRDAMSIWRCPIPVAGWMRRLKRKYSILFLRLNSPVYEGFQRALQPH